MPGIMYADVLANNRVQSYLPGESVSETRCHQSCICCLMAVLTRKFGTRRVGEQPFLDGSPLIGVLICCYHWLHHHCLYIIWPGQLYHNIANSAGGNRQSCCYWDSH